MAERELTQANGYANGRPDGREVHELDGVIERAIHKIPAATKLYPDIYSWAVTDAVLAWREHTRWEASGPGPLRVNLEAVEEDLIPRTEVQSRLIAGNLGEEMGQAQIPAVLQALVDEVRYLRERLGLVDGPS